MSLGKAAGPVRVAVIGIGWWSNVLAAAAKRGRNIEVAGCFTRSRDKRDAFVAEFGGRAFDSFDQVLEAGDIEAIINTTPNHVHRETTVAAAEAGVHVFLDKPIANTIADGLALTRACAKAGVVLALGYQRRREPQFRWVRDQIAAGRFGIMVQAEGNISRDRAGQFEQGHWRYTAEGMPGGVMLQIGLHYVDVLEMLLGPVEEVSGLASQLVLPGDNPDVGSLLMRHQNGAISTLSTSYASAAEHYVMNVYGKEMSAFFDLHAGFRYVKRGEKDAHAMTFEEVDTIADELDEWAAAIRGHGAPEVGGLLATRSLAVVLAGVRSVEEGRAVPIAEMMAEAD
jgi:predicted dehydrogenase